MKRTDLLFLQFIHQDSLSAPPEGLFCYLQLGFVSVVFAIYNYCIKVLAGLAALSVRLLEKSRQNSKVLPLKDFQVHKTENRVVEVGSVCQCQFCHLFYPSVKKVENTFFGLQNLSKKIRQPHTTKPTKLETPTGSLRLSLLDSTQKLACQRFRVLSVQNADKTSTKADTVLGFLVSSYLNRLLFIYKRKKEYIFLFIEKLCLDIYSTSIVKLRTPVGSLTLIEETR